jgi:hypothetical protein
VPELPREIHPVVHRPEPHPITLPTARAGGRPRRLTAERELLGILAFAGALAATALLPGHPAAGADLWLVAAALGSGLALLLFGLRFREPR